MFQQPRPSIIKPPHPKNDSNYINIVSPVTILSPGQTSSITYYSGKAPKKTKHLDKHRAKKSKKASTYQQQFLPD